MKIFLPQGEQFIKNEFTERDWEDYLRVHCHLTEFALVLGKNQLSERAKVIYCSVINDITLTLDRRLAMFLAMVAERDQFRSHDYAFLLEHQALIKAAFSTMCCEDQEWLLSEGLIWSAISRVNDKIFKLPNAFLDVMGAVSPRVRINAIRGLKWNDLSHTTEERIYSLIRKLPIAQQLLAFNLLTEAPPYLGLSSMLGFVDGFRYFLSLMEPRQRLNELLRENPLGVKLIIYCIEHTEIMRVIFETLTPQQCMVLFTEKHISGESHFSSMLTNPGAVDLLVRHLNVTEITALCMQPLASFNKNSIIVGYVLRHFQHTDVMQSIGIILHALPFHDRLQFLAHRDSMGVNLIEARPNDQKAAIRYKELIASLISPTQEFRRITQKYENVLSQYDLHNIKIRNEVELLEACYHVELQMMLSYFLKKCEKSNDTLQTLLLSMLTERYLDIDNGFLTFTNFPLSPVNRMFFELIQVMYNPKNLSELVSAFMGKGKAALMQCLFEIPEVFPEGLSYKEKILFFRHSAPAVTHTWVLSSLRHLPPTLEALSTLAFQGGIAIPLNDIRHYRLQRHIKLYQYLNEKHPEIAAAIYNHNSHWKSLSEDIQVIVNAGMSPRQAIEALIQDLKRGGEAYTGQAMEAGEVASAAIVKFLTYYNSLPVELKKSLDLLKASDQVAVLAVLPQKLSAYVCVEQLSKTLDDFLKANVDEPCLSINSSISSEFIALAEKKCRAGIDTQKDQRLMHAPIPSWLAQRIVDGMTLRDLDKKIHKLATIPNRFINHLFRYIALQNVGATFTKLSQAFNENLFTDEKRIVILAGIANNGQRADFRAHIDHLYAQYRSVLEGAPHLLRAFLNDVTSEGLYNVLKYQNESALPESHLFSTMLNNPMLAENTNLVISALDIEALIKLLKEKSNHIPIFMLLAKQSILLFKNVCERLGTKAISNIIDDFDEAIATLVDMLGSQLSEQDYVQFKAVFESLGYAVPSQPRMMI